MSSFLGLAMMSGLCQVLCFTCSLSEERCRKARDVACGECRVFFPVQVVIMCWEEVDKKLAVCVLYNSSLDKVRSVCLTVLKYN